MLEQVIKEMNLLDDTKHEFAISIFLKHMGEHLYPSWSYSCHIKMNDQGVSILTFSDMNIAYYMGIINKPQIICKIT